MNYKDLRWRKIKPKDISQIENFLLKIEEDYVGACGRFLTRVEPRDTVWILCDKKDQISAIVINSKSTVVPVLPGLGSEASSSKEIPDEKTLKGFLQKKKIHSIQGLKNEVILMENLIKQIGWQSIDIFDYDLMSLDKQPEKK